MTITRVPKFQDPLVTEFLTEYLRELDRTGKDVLHSNTANRSLLLYSPNKSVWEIKVSDAGAITVTKVSG